MSQIFLVEFHTRKLIPTAKEQPGLSQTLLHRDDLHTYFLSEVSHEVYNEKYFSHVKTNGPH